MDSIFNNAAVVLLLINEKRETVDINRAGEIFSGNRKDDVLGMLAGQATNCINAIDRGKSVCGKGKKCGGCIINRCLEDSFVKGKKIYKKEGTMCLKNEKGQISEFNVLVSSSIIEKDGQRMALVTLDDITKQKALEKELQEINATKDKFFSIVAHDLKNPFNSILGYSELLMDMVDDKSVDEDQQIFVEYLHNSSKQAYSLLEDLLTWARMQMNHISFNPESLSLANIIEENIELHKLAAAKKDIDIKSRLSEDMNVIADKFMASTVVRNLLSNAVKFTKDKGLIEISVSKTDDNMVRLAITDEGHGISDVIIEKLFKIEEKYTTLGTNGEKGTGLGLVLCKEFIEKNGGQIGVESQVGKGSSFWFTLPLN